jgi:hypothetical protein
MVLLNSRGFSSQKEAVSGRIEKKFVYPHLGDARRRFCRHYAGVADRTVSRTLFRHTKRLAGNSLVAVATGGFEVLVNGALNSVELTNQFLRFPRVRQQTRGNFSFEYLVFTLNISYLQSRFGQNVAYSDRPRTCRCVPCTRKAALRHARLSQNFAGPRERRHAGIGFQSDRRRRGSEASNPTVWVIFKHLRR